MTDEKSRFGTSPAFLLFLVFLILQLTNVIDWSWWWITAPLWVVAVLYVIIFILRTRKVVK